MSAKKIFKYLSNKVSILKHLPMLFYLVLMAVEEDLVLNIWQEKWNMNLYT